ncbi:tetratricopeptide repeat protein [Caenimonas koreensis]|uniref:tetratricopeptide repeat protein n=1 Tax=Caenimonas koreensis TaxID=367474 RepID=UPI003784931D
MKTTRTTSNAAPAPALAAAFAAHAGGNMHEAERICRAVLAHDESNADAWHLLGGLMLQACDFPQAQAHFAKALALREDATYLLNFARALQAQHQLDAAQAALRRAAALAPGNPEIQHQLGVVLLEAGRPGQAELAFRARLACGPRDAATLFALGSALLSQSRLQDAHAALLEATQLQPGFADAWLQLGLVLNQLNQLQASEQALRKAIDLGLVSAEAFHALAVAVQRRRQSAQAEALYARAIELKPDFAAAINGLGSIHRQCGRYVEAEAAFRHALELDPRHFWALNNLGGLLAGLNRPGEAQAAFRQALALEPANADARLNLGLLLLANGDFHEGWPLYEARYESGRFDEQFPTPDYPFPLWQGESLTGKSLVVWSEQGFGDTVQVARYAAMLRQRGLAKLTWVCRPALQALIATVDGIDHVIDERAPVAPHDYWCRAMSLPLRFATDLGTIPAQLPYLRAPPSRIDKWRTHLPAGGFKVGLVWKGSPHHMNNANRSLPGLETLAPLWSVPGVTFVSLQKDADQEQALHPPPGQPILTLGNDIEDFADTAAIIELLDLVISVDTATVHVAGALGKPVWVLQPAFGIDFRWLDNRDDSPWYPGVMRLFHQTAAQDWAPVIEQVRDALREAAAHEAGHQEPAQLQNAQLKMDAKAAIAAGFAAHTAGRLEEAQAAYQRALDADPASADAWHFLGGVRLQSGDLASAEAHFRKALELREDPLFLLNLSRPLEAQQRWDEGIAALRRGCELAPQNQEMRYRLGVLLLNARRFGEAEAALRTALTLGPREAAMLYPLGTTLEKLNRLEEAEAALREAIALKPDYADAWFHLGLVLNRRVQLAESEDAHRKAIAFGQTSPESYQGLAVALQRRRKWDEADATFRHALALKPDFAAAVNGMGTTHQQRGDLASAEADFRRAIELDPEHFWAYNNLGVLLAGLGRRTEAEAMLRRALELQPNNADALINLGFLLLASGRFEEGWPYYEARHKPGRFDGSLRSPEYPFPMWKGEPLAGKSLVIWSEQGYGDTIQIVRYVPLLRQLGITRLTWVCRRPLRDLLAGVVGIDAIVDQKASPAPHDYWCHAMSLPLRLGTRLDNIPAQLPYLRAPAQRIEKWRARLPAGGFKVGLVWKGSTSHLNDEHRSLPGLQTLAPLWSVPGVTFISLQKGAGEQQALKPPADQPIAALGNDIDDFADAAAIIEQLDLVISIDTAPVHLAGALGKPVWVLLPARGIDFRWLIDRKDSPWYPGVMRLFHQATSGDWSAVIDEVRTELRKLAPAGSMAPQAGKPLLAPPARPAANTALDEAIALHSAGKLKQAEAAYRQLLDRSPDNADAWHLLGGVYLQSSDFVQAEAHFRHALTLREDPLFLLNLSRPLEAQRKWDEAVQVARRAIELLPESIDMRHRLGEVLLQAGRLEEAEQAFRAAIAVAPTYAPSWLQLGQVLGRRSQLEEAEKAHRKAVDLGLVSAEALHGLGVALQRLRKFDEAEAMFRRAIDTNADFAPAINGIGTCHLRRGEFAQAETALRRALEIEPRDIYTLNNLSMVLSDTGRRDEAETLLRRALDIGQAGDDTSAPHIATVQLNLGMLLLESGRLEEGWPLYEARYQPGRFDTTLRTPAYAFPMWTGEPLAGKSLVIWSEQGFGDTLQIVRYAAMLRERGLSTLTWVCHPALHELLSAVEGIDAVIDHDTPPPPHDYWCYAMSLPLRFSTSLATIPAKLPYLRAPADRLAKWRPRLPPAGFKVALVWKGSASHFNDAQRSLPGLQTLAPLWSVPGVSFISLQKGEGEQQAARPPANQPVLPLGHSIQDFADAAAIIEQVDLVITVDTATAHLAGALGKPVWVLLPARGVDFRWLLGRDDSPWYPGVMRLFRQSSTDWASVVKAVRTELAQRVPKEVAAHHTQLAMPNIVLSAPVRKPASTPAPPAQSAPAPTLPPLGELTALYEQGGRLMNAGDLAGAQSCLRQVLAKQEHPVVMLNLARVLRATKALDEAEALLRRAISLLPGAVEIQQLLGMVLLDAGRHEEAVTALELALAWDRNNLATLTALGRALEALGRLEEAEARLRSAIALQPMHTDAWFTLGHVLRKQGRLADAEAAHRFVVQQDPRSPEAVIGLVSVLAMQGAYDQAEALLRNAVQQHPEHAALQTRLAMVLQESGRTRDAVAQFRLALQSDPENFWALNNLGVLLGELGDSEQAQHMLLRALEVRPGSGDARLNLGMVLLAAGRFDEGWPHYEARNQQDRLGGSLYSPRHPFPRWTGEPLAGRSLLIWSEQGYGDTLQIVRYVPMLRQLGITRLSWACLPPMRALLASVEGIDEVIDLHDTPAPHDYWCHAMSLPLRLGTRLDTIPSKLPYLRALPQRMAKWRPRMPAAGLKVGLIWKGSTTHANDSHRSLPGLETLAPLWSVPGVTFVSLQKGAGEQQALKPPAGQPIVPLGNDIEDFADAAAIIEQLDLVIGVDTASVHLAGALGKPVWVMLPNYRVDWRWLQGRDDSPWYPGVMRLFRSTAEGGWPPVIDAVRAALAGLADKETQANQWFARANAARREGRTAQAEAGYRSAIALMPAAGRFHSNLGVLLRASGRAAEAEAAYRSAIEVEPGYAEAHANLGNLLRASGRVDEAEASYRAAIAAKPALLSAWNGLGALLVEQKRWDESETAFRRALEIDPQHAESWNNLGTMLQDARRIQESEEAYARALALKPDFADASNNLGVLLQKAGRGQEAQAIYERAKQFQPLDARFANNEAALLTEAKRWKEAESAYRRALELKPDYADAHNNLGALLHITNRPAEAEQELREALRLRPDSAETQLNLGSLLLTQGRLAQGWPYYEARYSSQLADPTVHAPNLPCPAWRGESLQGKSIILWPEQGFGDSIQFVRYAPMLKKLGASRVTVVCHPPLQPVLQTVAGVDEVVIDLRQLRTHDYWTFPLSLPMRFATTLESIPGELPYISADPARVAHWKKRLPESKLKIGLVWKGAAGHKNDMNRSLPSLATLAPLWAIPGATLVSLQKGQGEDEALHPPEGQPITALGQDIKDFGDTAAIIANLDIVICVDTAIAHLAGAMGKPVAVLLPAVGVDWRWLRERIDSPWYPGVMQLRRQPTPGDWATPIDALCQSIAPQRTPGQDLFDEAVRLQRSGHAEPAQIAYRSLLAIAPDHLGAHNNLAVLLETQGPSDEAEQLLRRAIALDASYTQARTSLANLLQRSGRLDEAEHLYRQVLEASAASPVKSSAEAQLGLGSLLLSEGKFKEGWPLYEARHSPVLTTPLVSAPELPFPPWCGESLEGKSIVIWPEQGLGDLIQFSRYAPVLKSMGAARVVVFCNKALEPVMRTVQGVDEVSVDVLPVCDYWCFALSLPLHCGTTLESIPAALPYISADAKRVKTWARRMPRAALKIGLVWKGAAGHANDMNRSVPSLAVLAPLWLVPGAAFVSLQKGQGEDEAAHPPKGQPIKALGEQIEDFGDTAAIIASLDIVVCVDTAVAHLAAAMGKPVALLLSARGTDWRWLRERTDSPWYPGVMRLFRQPVPGDWATPVAQVVAQLAAAAPAATVQAATPAATPAAKPARKAAAAKPRAKTPRAPKATDSAAKPPRPKRGA